jgi:hypothetical protein
MRRVTTELVMSLYSTHKGYIDYGDMSFYRTCKLSYIMTTYY